VGEGKRIIMRFRGFRPGYDYAWNRLLLEFAKLCKKIGWTDLKIQTGFGFSTSGAEASGIAKITPELREFEVIMLKRKE
ncbi:MAG: hypothetical protein RTU30_14750, partial [Candidatus Thorarchaeota archaeon]